MVLNDVTLDNLLLWLALGSPGRERQATLGKEGDPLWVVRKAFSAQEFWIEKMDHHWTNTTSMLWRFIAAAALDTS